MGVYFVLAIIIIILFTIQLTLNKIYLELKEINSRRKNEE
ncbi:hypothetical protein HMPREF9225_1900 [Peptoniphilus duerdenii ATCC BAA-1640]|uniref:CcmD family protein n=1 Tax=Peptoniphilus duerdenii ATCC BAA-1640 TaxID=862517 RepID=E0NP11_9FIRM|nr:hypothetical protein HMPREF9225_1900 [Peptoniphilus duerdenii ATCC BAA-1640]ERT63572.1 hypothetical protein HMPREF1252_0700 [Peptoniphilus sp. BV3AC2]